MKLRTSFFNFRVLRKNLSRFAPLWILYALGEVLGLLSMDLESAGRVAENLTYIMGPVAIFHGVYALLVAACLFGDLFDSRMCNGLHAMPMRREGWLLTNLASGLVFALIPAIVGGVFGAIVLREYWWIALLWQAASLLQFVFFFGIAVFSAMCAGKKLGMVAIYAIVNFLSMLICWVATLIYEPLLRGVVLSDDWFTLFCPLISFTADTYLDFYYDWILGGFFKGVIFRDWYYLFICAGVGVVFAVLAWLLYRKRHLETAGDFISFRPMRLFFLIAYTFAMGALLYSFGDLFGTYKDYGFLAVGLIIGFFTGWMLLERTVKVFTKKALLGFAAFAAIFIGSIGLTILDPMGLVAYIPQTEKIDTACIYLQQDQFNYQNDEAGDGWYITDPAEIEQVRQLHSQMLETPEDTSDEYITVYVRYRLDSGIHVSRQYKIAAQSETAEVLKHFFSDPRSVFTTSDWQHIKDNVEYTCVYWNEDRLPTDIIDRQQMLALLNAIEADCRAGNFAQHDYFHQHEMYAAGIDIAWMAADDIGYRNTISEHVIVYEDCVNTMAFLKSLDEKE